MPTPFTDSTTTKEPIMETTLPTHDSLVDWLTNRVAAYLSIDPSAIQTDVALTDYGLDSVFALNLCTDLEFELNLFAQPTIAWDYPTIDAIAGHLTQELGSAS